MLCLICAQASYLKKIQWSCNLDLSFISKGFSNWKDATNKFQRHAVSKTHKEAVLKMVTLSSSVNIALRSLKERNMNDDNAFLR